jgi:Flp pilus assembly protein CpaB
MAVKADEIIGVSGFIVPDDRVDVIVTTTPPGSQNQDDKVSRSCCRISECSLWHKAWSRRTASHG